MVDSGWDWDQIPFELPMDVKLMIQATPIAMTGRGEDRLVWMENPRGVFDLKSAYSIVGNFDPSPSFAAGWIWKVKTLPKIKTFLWRCAYQPMKVLELRLAWLEEDWVMKRFVLSA